METSISATPAPVPSPWVPQRPLVGQPLFQAAVLYSPAAAGKATVELGAVVSTSQV